MLEGDNLDYLNTALSALFSVVALFMLTKLMGNQQVSEMRFFDYVVGITIGSIAAEMATALEHNPFIPLIAMAVYTLVSILISYLSIKSLKLRKILDGVPIKVFSEGRFIIKNMRKAKIDIHSLLALCRNNGYFDISQIKTIVYEDNGKISILPYPNDRPVTPRDLSIAVKNESLQYNVIVDGRVLDGNLRFAGKSREWLKNELKKKNKTDQYGIMLATVDENDTLSIYEADRQSADRMAF